jgi:penicillin amidase
MKIRRICDLRIFLCVGLAFCIVLISSADARAVAFKLSAKAVVQYDTYGVPHIKASSDADLYFAQGYTTARDRLWQMEYSRRLAAGRLAEIFDRSFVKRDFAIRRIGLYRAAVATYNSLSSEMKTLLTAYAAGVNYYVTTHKDNLPREFKDLALAPEPWRPADSLAIPLTMFWGLSGSMEEELRLAQLVDELGAEKALELVSGEPADPETHIQWQQASAIIPEGIGRDGFEILANLKELFPGGSATRLIGSNNWVIDGALSASGAPILSNDPHLRLLNPPIWYEIHLMGPGINVIGSTFPGVPGVIIGHNERMAWGVTNVGYDVCDLYVEKLSESDPSKYIYKGEQKSFQEVVETIKYRDGGSMKEVKRTIQYSVHGPVVEKQADSAISMRWTGHEPSTETRFIYLLNRAANLSEFRTALSYYRLAAQNFIYADIDGNIFYQPTGKVPIRNGTPYLPLDGSSGEHEWESYIPYDELPRVLNPPEHFIATANARPVDATYPYYIGYFFDIGYRVSRIKELLKAEDILTFEGVRAIQADSYALAAERLKAMLIADVEREKSLMSGRALKAAKMVEQWDNYSTTESVESSIFHKWLERIAWNILKDDLREDSFRYWASNPDIVIVLLLRTEKANGLKYDWFDDARTSRREERRHIIARSLNEALSELGLMFGYEMDNWKWGKIHTSTLRHALGRRDPRYNNGPYPRNGSIDTVDNAGFALFRGDFASGAGPSMRMTVELTPGVERAVNAIPGGQSGDASSKHYQDQLIDYWLKHRAHPMLFTKEQIQANLAQTLSLVPTED